MLREQFESGQGTKPTHLRQPGYDRATVVQVILEKSVRLADVLTAR
jgi:hypothetical protein